VAERRRIVTLDAAGAATVVKDLEDTTTYCSVQGAWQVKPGEAKPVWAIKQRPYGGAVQASETHDNGSIVSKVLVRGSTQDDALLDAESLFAALKTTRLDLFYEWRPDGATVSTFYEIRGVAKVTAPTYSWALYLQEKAWYVDYEIPVGPLARVAPTTITLGTPTLPAVVALGTAIPGSAPALADVQIRTGAGSGAAPVWAMFAWWKRAGAPLAGSVAPVGIIEAETGTLTTFVDTGVDATFRGSHGITATAAGAGTASAIFGLDPSVLDVDDFTLSDIDIEVWARVKLSSTLVSPRLTLSLLDGNAVGRQQYTAEWGSVGKPLTVPSAGSAFRAVKLGTLSMPVDKATPLKWNAIVLASWAAGSTGSLEIDYFVLVPSRSRALSPSSKPLDGTFPKFISSNVDTSKVIRGADLSGRISAATAALARDAGLGGSLIELPPGNVDMLLWLSSVVPDDPTVDAQTQQLAHTLISPTSQVLVTPRFYLAKGQ
jgi:hypothetical protein